MVIYFSIYLILKAGNKTKVKDKLKSNLKFSKIYKVVCM